MLLFLSFVSLYANDEFEFAILKHSGDYKVREKSVKTIVSELMVRTSIDAKFSPIFISPSSETLFNIPLVFLMGSTAFKQFNKKEITNLRQYLQFGGTLVIDNSSGEKNGGFDISARNLVQQLYPNKKLEKLPLDHSIYRTFYLLRSQYFGGRVKSLPYLLGIQEYDRASVIYSLNDVAGAWQKNSNGSYMYDVLPGGEKQRKTALKFGVNVIMYSMTVNYKKDAVHVKTLLKRRKFARPPWIK